MTKSFSNNPITSPSQCSQEKDRQYQLCTNGKEPASHGHCFQWGYCVYCHDCKKMVATSYVSKYFKKPEWLTDKEIRHNDEVAQLD